MFEAAELGREISKAEFEKELPELRARLLSVQRNLRTTRHPVIVIVSGVEGAGKSQVVNGLHEWFDARGLQTHAFWQESDEDSERPRYWKFWRRLPPRGSIGIMFGSWYTRPIIDRVYKRASRADLDRELQRIVFFERMLAEDGALILKFWYHLPKDEQTRRLEAKDKRSGKNWLFGPNAKQFAKKYDRFAKVSERALRITDTAEAPWHIIEATDARYRDLTTAKTILSALEDLLTIGGESRSGIAVVQAEEGGAISATGETILDRVDASKALDPEEYDAKLTKAQNRLGALAWRAWEQKRSTVIMFEGWDAAGKGGAIRRVIAPIDARLYQTISVAAPTDEERAQHYLWRFWRHLPRAGHMTIYDRSWYGRVLVERVEGFAKIEEWSRAYREINDFEEQLAESGIILLKFWIHIDSNEQLRRFEEREQIAWKQHKITEEDWRNREKWDAYKIAVSDMIARTSSAVAPWHVIPGNDKRFARVEVVRTVARELDGALR